MADYDEKKVHKAMPYEKYFGEMELSEKQKDDRVSFAEQLENVILMFLFLFDGMAKRDAIDTESLRSYIENGYTNVVSGVTDVDDYLQDYILIFADDIIQSTIRHQASEWYLSEDRGMYVAENETNTIYNYIEFEKAIASGKTKKTWIGILDGMQRDTHRKVSNVTIPIAEPFHVGDSLMMFPKDTSLGAEAKEIVNCRCSIKYS